jgi:hypothetical protein
MQRPDEALTQGKWALELDPLNPMIKVWYGAALTMVGDCKTAMAVLEEVLAVDPEHHIANSAFEEAAFQCGNYERAFEASMIIQKNIFEEDIIIKLEKIFEERGYAAAYRELVSQLESFAETNHFGAVAMAINYTKVNQLDKAMDWLEKGYEMHDTQMIYIATHQYNWDPLFDNPRFIDIVEKMKLPLP